VDANEDQLVGTGAGHDNAAPAGILIDAALLATRTVEGGPYSLSY
jgi:hypothetical protein